MNIISWFRRMTTLGARELRARLPDILRDRTRPYRVFVHNKPAVTIVPDDQFLFLMEVIQEVQNMGLLDKAISRIRDESKQRHPWFWSESWQQAHRSAEDDIAAGRVQEYGSVEDLIKGLER